MEPRRVLMVCLGNICRSPVAQGALEDSLRTQFGEHHGWSVDSAGTIATHQGEAPDARSQASARRGGLDISTQRSRPIQAEDFETFDHILVMDRSNYADVLLRAPETAQSKVSMVLDASFPGEGREVPDPYWGGDQGFEQVTQLLKQATNDWLIRWQHEELSM